MEDDTLSERTVDHDNETLSPPPTIPSPHPLGDVGVSTPVDQQFELDRLLTELGLHDGKGSKAVDDSGRFTIVGEIGKGAMGAVYRVHDAELDRHIALKVIQMVAPSRDHLQTRLVREARALARLSHRNVVQVYDLPIASSGERAIALEYIDGPTLRLWQEGRAVDEVIEMYIGVGRGLAAAHDAGVTHRDFKPENGLVRPNGEGHRAVVIDFGLAAGGVIREHTADASPINTGSTGIGTLQYMAPEQHTQPATPLCDQYAFCVSLWEAIAGERPFTIGRGPVDEVPPPPPRIPVWLYRILRRGLAWDPQDRFVSMNALVLRVESARRSRARVRWVLPLLLLVGLLGGIIWARRPTPCADAGEAMALTWNDDVRTGIRRNLSAGDEDWSERGAELALVTLDSVASAWASQSKTLCEAELRQGRNTTFDRRRACLERSLALFGGSLSLFEQGDPRSMKNLVDVLGLLTEKDYCLSPPPALESSVEAQLVAAHVHERARDFQLALDYSQAAILVAAKSRPCIKGGTHSFESAAANFRLGHVLGKLERWDESKQTLKTAAVHALACEDWQTAFDVRAYQGFVDIRAHPANAELAQARLADAEALLEPVEGTLGPGLRRIEYMRMLGLVAASGPDPNYEAAVEILVEAQERLDGFDDPPLDRRVQLRHNLGWAQQLAGHYEEANFAYTDGTKMLATAVGEEHPATVQMRSLADVNRGIMALETRRYDEADALFSIAAENGDLIVVSKAYSGWVQGRLRDGDIENSASIALRFRRWLAGQPSLPSSIRAESLYVIGQSLTQSSLRDGGGVDDVETFAAGLGCLFDALGTWPAASPGGAAQLQYVVASTLYEAQRYEEAQVVLSRLLAADPSAALSDYAQDLQKLIWDVSER